MGITAFRQRERRALALKDAPKPARQISDSEALERSRSECNALRAKIAEQAKRIAELEQMLDSAPAQTNQQQRQQENQKRRGKP